MLAPYHRILFSRCRHGEGDGGEVPVPAAHRDSDASTRPRFPRNRPSGDRLRPGARPRPCDQASDSREMEGPAVESSHWLDCLHHTPRGSHAVACQCVCSLPTPTGRLGRCRLLPSLRHQCIRLTIELPVDYAPDSCSPAASQATTAPCTFLQSLQRGPPPCHGIMQVRYQSCYLKVSVLLLTLVRTMISPR